MNFHCDSSDDDASDSNSMSVLDWNYFNDTIDETIDKTRADQNCLIHDISRSISSHFLMSNHFRIIRRSVAMHENARTSFLMQQLVTSHDSHAVSLLHPESIIFPSIYCKNVFNNSSLGCIPHHFYLLGPHVPHDGIASILKHTHVRIRDGSLATSTSDQCLHFAFDVKMNSRLNNNSSEMVFKRGFEHLMEQGISGHEHMQTAIEFDEFDFNRKVKELSSLMREKP